MTLNVLHSTQDRRPGEILNIYLSLLDLPLGKGRAYKMPKMVVHYTSYMSRRVSK